MPPSFRSRGAGLLALVLALACLRAAPPTAALLADSWPEPPPEAPLLAPPPLVTRALDELRSGAVPWLLVAQSMRAQLEGRPAPACRELDALLGEGPRAFPLPELTPGLHSLEAGAVRGTLAVSTAPDGSLRVALGARGGPSDLVISARGRLDPADAGAPAALELLADVSWGGASSWSAVLATAPANPLRASNASARSSGTLRVNVTAPDGLTGELALEFASEGLRARGRWPTGTGAFEEISSAGSRVLVESPRIRAELPADGGSLTWRAVDLHAGRVAAVASGRADVGTWQDLAAEPPAAGLFRVLAGRRLVVTDHLGREKAEL